MSFPRFVISHLAGLTDCSRVTLCRQRRKFTILPTFHRPSRKKNTGFSLEKLPKGRQSQCKSILSVWKRSEVRPLRFCRIEFCIFWLSGLVFRVQFTVLCHSSRSSEMSGLQWSSPWKSIEVARKMETEASGKVSGLSPSLGKQWGRCGDV